MLINNFQRGLTSSPYAVDGAFAKSAGLDVFSQPGIARINYKPLKKSAASGEHEVTELITSWVRNPDPPSVGWYSPTDNVAGQWDSPEKAHSSNDDYATYEEGVSTGRNQIYFDFDAVVPDGATITGIEVQVEAKTSAGTKFMSVYLTKDKVAFTAHRNVAVTTTEHYISVGGSGDMWGTTWTPAEVNATNFGLKISALGAGMVYSFDHVRVKVYYEGDTIYAAGESGTIWQSTDSGDTWTVLSASKGKYITIWKNHLVGALGTELNFYNLSTSSWVAFANTTPLNSSPEHFMMVSENDGYLYICDEFSVASLVENAGQTFAPDTAATYTYYADKHGTAALTLYEPYRAICLSEQRENILVGATQGTSTDPRVSSSIFVWDRVTQEFDFPVFLSGEFITGMINIQNRVFIVTDKVGKVYSFSESGLTLVKEIPFDYGAGDIRIGNKGHSSMTFWRNKIILGISSDDGLSPAGIYGLYGKAINCEHLISTGEDGSNDDLDIGAVYSFDGDTLLYGWYDKENTKYGIDKIDISYNRATGYAAYFETPLVKVGTSFKPANFQQIEVQLARALQEGEGVRIRYKKNAETSWTTMDTFEYSTYGAVSSLKTSIAIHGAENLRIRCDLTTGASSTATPYIYAIRLT